MKKILSHPLCGNLLVVFAYTALTLIYTDPLWRHFSEAIPGYNDVWSFYWSCWWFKKALTELFTNPFYPDYIFYPAGTCILLSTIAFLHSMLSIPLQYIVGLVAAFNLLTVVSFVLSAWGTFLLVRYLTGNAPASFFAGFIYGFWPWRMVKLAVGHHNLLCTEWIPFFALFFIKTFEEEDWLNPVWAALFFTLTFYSETTYLVFLILFGIGFGCFKIIQGITLPVCKRLIVFSAAAIVFAAPLLLPMLYEMTAVPYIHGKAGRIESNQFSADLVSFVTPTYMHRFLGERFEGVRKTFHFILDENSLYMGWVVAGIGLLTMLFVKDKKLLFWKLSCIFFFIMALGHTLHVFGKNVFPEIYLPYEYYFRIPLINFSRAPSRIFVIGMLCFSVICGFGCKKFIAYAAAQKKYLSWLLLLLAVPVFIACFLDYWPKAFLLTDPQKKFYYYKMFAQDTEDYATITLPAVFNPNELGGQTVSGKRTVVGATARTPESAEIFAHTAPVLKYLVDPSLYKQLDPGEIERGKKILADYNIRYIIFHHHAYRQEPGKSHLKKHLALLAQIGATKIFDDREEMIFDIGKTLRSGIDRHNFVCFWEAAKVDGTDDVLFSGRSARVRHIDFNPAEGVRYECYEPVRLTENQVYEVLAVQGRGTVTVLEQPDRNNGGTLAVRVDDRGFPGDDYYRFLVLKKPGPETPR